VSGVGLNGAVAQADEASPPAPVVTPCPLTELPADTRCYSGQDSNGAWFLIAIPPQWNRGLVVHSHGGPSLDAPNARSPVADLKRFSVVVKEGYAWAGSSYRHAGFGVRDAAEDTDNLRKLFWKAFGRPSFTLLHGQSWGAGISVKTAELYSAARGETKRIYDGVVLTSGVLGGGSYSYDFRADLRAVYQYYCQNHPSPDDPPYPLWQGLSADSTMTPKQLAARVNSCTGVDLPAEQRTPEQARKLRNILAVVRIPERTLQSHLAWATFTFRDLVLRQLSGRNPFSNAGVVYSGSDDDRALNKGVTRFTADADAVRLLSDDADLSGKLPVPTLTLHAIHDPTAFIELEDSFRQVVNAAGAQANLVQVFTDRDQHQTLSNPEYAAAFQAMRNWLETASRPDAAAVADLCRINLKTYGESCRIVPGYVLPSLSKRVPARSKPGLRQAEVSTSK
jgi:hypothetical protein